MNSAAHRSGFAALIGRPNVGKSTLLNRILRTKLSIVSKKPQTTRNRILGVHKTAEYELAMVDTPGLHDAQGVLGKRMVEEALSALDDVDVVAWLIDPRIEHNPKHPSSLLPVAMGCGKPVVLVLNKIDQLHRPELLPIIAAYSAAGSFAGVVPLSALKGDGVDNLLSELASRLPEGPAMFDDDTLTDRPLRFLVAELVREKVVRLTGQELPYASATLVEHWDESVKPMRILVKVVVERASQKAMVIGAGGERIKRISMDARREVEKLLDRRVHLELFVSVDPKWSRRPGRVELLGHFE